MREFNQYPHHEDIYPKHKITSSELCFLAELQKEMNTQDTWSQADPRIWVIQEDTIQYLDMINDMIPQDDLKENVIEYAFEKADGYQLFIDGDCYESEDEIYHKLLDIIQEEQKSGMHQGTQVRFEDEEIVIREPLSNIDKDISWKGLNDIVDWIDGQTLCEVELKFYNDVQYTHPGTFFLTYEEGVKYLQRFGYRYSDTARLYAISLNETSQIKQLFDILHTVEFSNKNQKIYISGPITGTDDYLDRFADAEKALKEIGYINIVNPAEEGTKLPEDSSHEDYMRLSFDLLKDCDAIYLLKGWKKSPGANQEYGYAIAKGMEIKYEGIC